MRFVLSSKMMSRFERNKFLFEATASSAEYTYFAGHHWSALLHTFTLLDISVGKAPSVDLARHRLHDSLHSPALLLQRNVLRLRIEYMQILFHLWSLHSMV